MYTFLGHPVGRELCFAVSQKLVNEDVITEGSCMKIMFVS